MLPIKHFLLKYLNYIQVLILGGFFYLLSWLLINYIAPEKIAHLFWPDAYLPLQLLLWGGNFFTFTFLTQNKNYGLWLAAVCFLWLFFILAHFALTLPLIIALLTSSTLLWIYLVLWPQKKPEAKSKQS